LDKIAQHKILLSGSSFDHCRGQVERFFDRTTLVMYDTIQVVEEKSFSGLNGSFWRVISQAEEQNRTLTRELIEELKKNGYQSIDSLQNTHQGYESKLLHILSHMLDGFIGIDSCFYNLIDDSHWLPGKTVTAIRENRQKYWLLHLDCFASTTEEAGLLHM